MVIRPVVHAYWEVNKNGKTSKQIGDDRYLEKEGIWWHEIWRVIFNRCCEYVIWFWWWSIPSLRCSAILTYWRRRRRLNGMRFGVCDFKGVGNMSVEFGNDPSSGWGVHAMLINRGEEVNKWRHMFTSKQELWWSARASAREGETGSRPTLELVRRGGEATSSPATLYIARWLSAHTRTHPLQEWQSVPGCSAYMEVIMCAVPIDVAHYPGVS
jgi:hypothetical protein